MVTTAALPTIDFVKFSKLYNWSVQYSLDDTFSYNQDLPLVAIGSFLNRSRKVIEVKNGVIYKRVTIKINNGGVLLRDMAKGEDIGTKRQFLIKQGQFIFSKIDARNGAMGIVPDDLEGAIVTNDFPVFDVDNSIVNTEYLVLITTTKKFIDFAQSCSSGTTNRQRMDVESFLKVEIPLPPLDEDDAIKKGLPTTCTQEQLVSAFKDKIKQAEELKKVAIEKESEIFNFLHERLEISKSNSTIQVGLNFIKFKNIDLWSLDKILHQASNLFPHKKIGQICKISSGGTPSRSRPDYFGGDIPWIKTGELTNDIIYSTEEYISLKGLQNSSAKLYSPGSIVVAMYGATIGKTAKLGVQAATNQACAVLCNFSDDVVDDYVWIFLQSQTDILKSKAYGSAQPNINARMIYDTKIPMPSKLIQEQIILEFKLRKNEARDYFSKASEFKKQAHIDFEHQIFNEN